MLQGSVGDPGPVGYSGMKVECTEVLTKHKFSILEQKCQERCVRCSVDAKEIAVASLFLFIV